MVLYFVQHQLPFWRIVRRLWTPKRNFQGKRREVLDAIIRGDDEDIREVVELIRKNDPNFNIDAPLGSSTFLCIAARSQRSLSCVRTLIELGADVNAEDSQGVSPLVHAARNGQHETLLVLLECGASWDVTDTEGWTPLHRTSLNGRIECAKILLEKGADPNLRNDIGSTPVHCACNSGHASTLELLIQFGGDVKIQNYLGDTPLHSAASNGCSMCIPYLFLDGETANVVNKEGETPLMKAARKGHKFFVASLIAENPFGQIDKMVELLMEDQRYKPEEQENIQAVVKYVALINDCCYLYTISEHLCRIIKLQGLKILDSGDASNFDALSRSYVNSVKTLTTLIEFVSESRTNVPLKFSKCPFEPMNKIWDMIDDMLSQQPKEYNQQLKNIITVLSGFNHLCSSEAEHFLVTKHEQGACFDVRRFIQLVTKHKDLFVVLITKDLSLLTGPMDFILAHSILLENPDIKALVRSIPFENKRNWLKEKLQADKKTAAAENTLITNEIIVSRASILSDSCSSFQSVTGDMLKTGLNVRFAGEEGTGAGVEREWFSMLAHEMFNQDNALFKITSQNTFQPNSTSYVNPDHFSYFFFVGQVIALAIFHEEPLDIHFTRSFYKHILGIPVSWTDLEAVDMEFFKNLQWILSNPISDIGLELTFSSEYDNFGELEVVDLKPNGRDIPVTDENKEEYAQLIGEFKITRAISKQIEYFLDGFHTILPASYIAVFNEFELELLISGAPKIDIDDWENNTAYTGFTPTDPQIEWYWSIVKEMTEEQKALLLQFTTGTSGLPIGGFAQLKGVGGLTKFTISKKPEASDESLPTASTCFNLLRLPVYTSYDQLKQKLLLAITFGSVGFSFS
eukprot:TRINITY_DN10753_c0_g1_i1.p1 TRINITY_DN10753_c0_g1~~TRINITY_DN10753_c0_g1_i1.p1  ORF type:complete len:857 (-),score=176.60 TRINITY_DN10753_c0_g1_i1:30-2600(-)